MSRLNPQAFLNVLKKEAVKYGMDFKAFFDNQRIFANAHRSDKKRCLRLEDLVGCDFSLNLETLAHVKKCWFCSMLVKGAWLQSVSEDEQVKAFRYFTEIHKIPIEHFEARLLDDSGARKAHSEHLGYFEIVCFKSIDKNRRDHRKICKQCDTMMLILETIPLPDFS